MIRSNQRPGLAPMWVGRGLIGLPNMKALGKRNGLRARKARTQGCVREVRWKARERRVTEEGLEKH